MENNGKFGLPYKILIQKTYRNYTICQIVYEGEFKEPIEIISGVQQGGVFSPLVFLLVIHKC
jgi:hypothetical protein